MLHRPDVRRPRSMQFRILQLRNAGRSLLLWQHVQRRSLLQREQGLPVVIMVAPNCQAPGTNWHRRAHLRRHASLPVG